MSPESASSKKHTRQKDFLPELPASLQVDESVLALKRLQMDAILVAMARSHANVSDLFFVVGHPPHVELDGFIHALETDPPHTALSAEQIEEMFFLMTGGEDRLAWDYHSLGSCDFSYSVSMARFRVNYFRRNNQPAMVLRKLPATVPSISELNLPPVFSQIIREKNGLILVTGRTGHGKTTTLAALIDELNSNSAIHVVTLEDPIEFVHPIKRSIISQRELGRDFHDFSTGLRASLRQSPKVILIGEIRDRDTIEIALTAAETGHLVLGTLHTIDAGQSIGRILGMFDKDEEVLVRQRLTDTLRWVVSQRLVTKIGGGRHLLTEVMGHNLSTREAILTGEKEGRSFGEIIASCHTQGWHTFDQQILEAFREGWITEDTALLYSNQKTRLSKEFDSLRKEREFAESKPGDSGLRLDGPVLRARV